MKRLRLGDNAIWIAILIPVLFVTAGMCMMLIETTNDRLDFMKYCEQKGYSAEDCRWEWKRMSNGQRSTLMPTVFLK